MIISAHRNRAGEAHQVETDEQKKTEHNDSKRRTQVCALFSAYHKLYSMFFRRCVVWIHKINRISRKLNNGRAYITFFGA